MKGNEILLAANPTGQFLEGTISGVAKPGTCMEVKNAPMQNGRFVYQAWSKASGAKGQIVVLLQDWEHGKQYTDAFADGDHIKLYAPIPGEEFNMLVADVAGTADDVAIGDLFGPEQNTGKLKANSAYANPCFTAGEVITDPVADYWLFCTFNG